MKITVLNGTAVRGITYHFKEYFLGRFGDLETEQFYPADFPDFCTGCKTCFLKSERLCPHAEKTERIWESIMTSDLIVVAYPVYAMRVPGSLKTLLDHFCVHWLVHRPEEEMFRKKVVILTNSVGIAYQQRAAVKDVKTSFSWMGVSKIYHASAGMTGDIFWENLSPEHDAMLRAKANKVYKKARPERAASRMSATVKLKFFACKIMHAAILKSEQTPSADNAHYLKKGWIKDKKSRR